MLDFFLENILLVYLLEFLAALSGTFYLWNSAGASKMMRIFVYYLWSIVFVETLGMYPLYAYFNNYETLGFVKDTPFERNFWLYNSFKIVSFLVFFEFFTRKLSNAGLRKIYRVFIMVFAGTAVLNLLLSGVFFKAYSAFTCITGTFLLVVIISSYYYEMLGSNKILNFHKNIGFYISVGAFLWHLIVTPLFIYSHYFTMESPEFVAFHALVLKVANVFMYTCFTFGFLICSRKNNFYFSSIS